MSSSVLLLSDDLDRSKPIAEEFDRWFNVEQIGLSDCAGDADRDLLFVLFDIDFSNSESIKQVNSIFRSEFNSVDKIFLVGENYRDMVQANALGASDLLKCPLNAKNLKKVLFKYIEFMRRKKKPGASVHTEELLDDVLALQDEFFQAVRLKQPLPKEKILICSEEMVTSLRENSIGSWLDVVKTYHSYTHRHCMTVSGILVAFALHLGMRDADVQFLTLGGLVHDIGKVHIPLDILDKPGKLSDEERALINRHPGYSAEILRMDGQFGEDVIDLALHHHEYLDGSGYPDGLKGDEISDPVRLMTIVDIFSALIDKRSYKEAMPAEQAYEILQGMEGKLEMCLVEAFKQVALQVQGTNVSALQAAV